MTTLATPPLSTLLERLFAEAEATDAPLLEAMAKLTPEERAARAGRSDANETANLALAKDWYLAVSRETGVLCYMLARACRARRIVEFGTSFGVSTLHLAAALKDNGGGLVISSEYLPSKVARARENVNAAGLADFVEIREGDARETLARDLPDAIDLVLLDGAKGLYPHVLALLEKRLRAGALVIADNADLCPEYLKRVRAPGGDFLSVPWVGGVELSMKMAAESSATNVREHIEAGKIPRQVFQNLPRENHDATLNYLGYSDESAFYDFIAERGDGQIVRIDGLGVRDAIAAKYADCSGNISDNCCAGDLDHVKMEFHMFYSRLPRILLTR